MSPGGDILGGGCSCRLRVLCPGVLALWGGAEFCVPAGYKVLSAEALVPAVESVGLEKTGVMVRVHRGTHASLSLSLSCLQWALCCRWLTEHREFCWGTRRTLLTGWHWECQGHTGIP